MISIIIPVYNRPHIIKKLLDSIYQSTYKDFEVIVIDDASNDSTPKIVENYPCRLIKLTQNMGPAKARNIGVKYAKYNILLFFDSDVILYKDTIEKVAEDFKNPEVMAVVGVYSKEPAIENLFSKYRALLSYSFYKLNSVKYINVFLTAMGALRKKVFEEMGGFDEKSRIEDFELGQRISKRYKIILDREIKVKHHFPDFLRNLWTYFKGPYFWAKLFFRERKFDNYQSTSSSASRKLIGFLSFSSLILSALSPYFFLLFCGFLIFYLIINSKFFNLVLKEEGSLMLMAAIFFDYVLSVPVVIGAISGFIIWGFYSLLRLKQCT